MAVTVDCGATAHEPLAAAAEAGLDVIVVDHHVTEPLLPRAVALINPNRLDEDEPARRAGRGRGRLPAGRGAQPGAARGRLVRRAGAEPDLLQWLDLVALGTVCDVVPLTGLNRALVAQGIRVARGMANPGLAGAGRGRRGHLADRRLPSRLRARAAGQCRRPGRRRRSRRPAAGDRRPGARRRTRQPARRLQPRAPRDRGAHACRPRSQQVEARPQSPALVFAAAEGWHPGVIGIVAARLKERYERPACVVAHGRRHRQGLRPLGAGAGARPGGDRGAPGRAADQRRRPCDGGRVHGRRRAARRVARLSRRAARRRRRARGAGAGTGDRRRAVAPPARSPD